jgi:hypothetical protein
VPVAVPSFLKPHASVSLTDAAATDGTRTLNFNMVRQDLSNWCWAATTASVRAYYGNRPPPQQCEIATQVIGRPCCPPGKDNSPNNIMWALDDSLGNRLSRVIPRAMTFEEIVSEIDARRPICCHVTIGGGHFNAIIGYDTITREIDIVDPLYGPHNNINYDNFRLDYRGGRWDYSYLTK